LIGTYSACVGAMVHKTTLADSASGPMNLVYLQFFELFYARVEFEVQHSHKVRVVMYKFRVGGWGTVSWYHPSSYTVPDRLAEELS